MDFKKLFFLPCSVCVMGGATPSDSIFLGKQREGDMALKQQRRWTEVQFSRREWNVSFRA